MKPGRFVHVESRKDRTGQATPEAFALHSMRIEVVEILDAWPGRDHHYFKVRGSDGGLYMLRHDLLADVWQLSVLEESSG